MKKQDFKTLAEVKQANKTNNNHFFDRQTMKFFNSKIETSLIKNKYFITSEQFESDSLSGYIAKRYFTIREAKQNGEVITKSEFQQFKTLQEAKLALKNL